MSDSNSHVQGFKHARNTVQSIYIAIVLAFVLRAFVIEAFVIPTGSMATSLYGEHVQLVCPCCDWEYAFGVQRNPDGRLVQPTTAGKIQPVGAQCPNCSAPYTLFPEAKAVALGGGDRVLVTKYFYGLRQPTPWDVVVFKNPQNNRENYIKRLIGLPGESIQIVLGDVFYRDDASITAGADPELAWRIRRKPHHAQKVMWHVVHHADYPPDPERLAWAKDAAAPIDTPRWIPASDATHWDTAGSGGRVLTFTGGRAQTMNFHPGAFEFYPLGGYNVPENDTRRDGIDPERDICTDWKLEGVAEPTSWEPPQVKLIFAFDTDRYCAEFSDKAVRLLRQRRDAANDEWQEIGAAPGLTFSQDQGRRIALTKVDYRLCVWVDGEVVVDSPIDNAFQKAVSLATLGEQLNACRDRLFGLRDALGDDGVGSAAAIARQRAAAKAALREEEARQEALQQRWQWYQNPGVSIEASGGALMLRHVALHRDVYYTASRLGKFASTRAAEYPEFLRTRETIPATWRRPNPGDPGWGTFQHPIVLRKHETNADLDEFFCLGDNSSQSLDGRGWMTAAPSLRLYDEKGEPIYQMGTVPRYNILGRAAAVFWPSAFYLPFELPILKNFAVVPNVGRMRLIR